MHFRIAALGEAIIVGGAASVIGWIAAKQFKSPMLEHFIAGATIHLIFEITGIHRRFAKNLIAQENQNILT